MRYRKVSVDTICLPFHTRILISAVPIKADSLFHMFSTNENKANALYLDKAIAVTGTINEIGKNQDGKPVIILKTADPLYGIACTLKNDGIKLAQSVYYASTSSFLLSKTNPEHTFHYTPQSIINRLC